MLRQGDHESHRVVLLVREAAGSKTPESAGSRNHEGWDGRRVSVPEQGGGDTRFVGEAARRALQTQRDAAATAGRLVAAHD